MDDRFAASREHMVETQLKRRGVRDQAVLSAFSRVPRHAFVPEDLAYRAYYDGPLPIGFGQTISQPYIVAIMTIASAVQPGQRVLELGTGSGYQAAILMEMGAEVYTVERIAELHEEAVARLTRLGYTNFHAKVANGTLGWPEAGPFHAIVVTAGAPDVPRPLLEQLALGGRLVIPLEEEFSQVLYIVIRTEIGYERKRGEACTFVPLIGEHGWHSDPRE